MAVTKKSMNPIPSSLRGKKRYVKFALICATPIQEGDAKKALYSTFSQLFGEQGIAEQKLWPIKWRPEKNEGIVRCSLARLEEVKAGLLFIQRAGGQGVVPFIIAVSGSVGKLK